MQKPALLSDYTAVGKDGNLCIDDTGAPFHIYEVCKPHQVKNRSKFPCCSKLTEVAIPGEDLVLIEPHHGFLVNSDESAIYVARDASKGEIIEGHGG